MDPVTDDFPREEDPLTIAQIVQPQVMEEIIRRRESIHRVNEHYDNMGVRIMMWPYLCRGRLLLDRNNAGSDSDEERHAARVIHDYVVSLHTFNSSISDTTDKSDH